MVAGPNLKKGDALLKKVECQVCGWMQKTDSGLRGHFLVRSGSVWGH